MYTQLEQRGMSEPPVNVSTLRSMKDKGEPIVCLTAYDASYAALVDTAGVDLVLVGDSLGMVIQGHDTTIPVTVDDVVYHSRAVARGLRRAFLVADMPFMSYTNPEQALDNAVRLMQEGGAMMIKLEGGEGQVDIVEHLARHDIPVCAHVGLKPQSVHKIGGFKVQGRESKQAKEMLTVAMSQRAEPVVGVESTTWNRSYDFGLSVGIGVCGFGDGGRFCFSTSGGHWSSGISDDLSIGGSIRFCNGDCCRGRNSFCLVGS